MFKRCFDPCLKNGGQSLLFVGFLVFGPDKLPALGRAAGKALSEFKQATSGLTQDIRKNDSENKEDKQM
ncbi:twin-arginine translocase TatA/TatE family subunit [Bacillus subtilis]|nr:twin-arginine translocase TatA/TatE family subunit [Bacillus subtilis]MED3695127.1 twin-arginine translocase TatA/TatE family subunit [Bacillus subtilis]